MNALRVLIILFSFISSVTHGQSCDDGSSPVSQTIDLTNFESWDGFNDADNQTATLCGFPANGNVVGGVYSGVDLSPNGASWCSEVRIFFGSVVLVPASGENNPGPCDNNYSGGSVSIYQDLGVNFSADNSGCVNFQIYEAIDDEPNQIDAVITSGAITLYSCPEASILPIELNYFRGTAKASLNILQWETISEINSKWHIVERSENGKGDWVEIGKKEAVANSSTPIQYELRDMNPLPFGYYRLKEISKDGAVQYSVAISIERPIEKISIQSVSPQPASDWMEVMINAPQFANTEISLINLQGREVLTKYIEIETGLNNVKIEVGNIVPGTYFLRMKNGEYMEAKKVLIK